MVKVFNPRQFRRTIERRRFAAQRRGRTIASTGGLSGLSGKGSRRIIRIIPDILKLTVTERNRINFNSSFNNVRNAVSRELAQRSLRAKAGISGKLGQKEKLVTRTDAFGNLIIISGRRFTPRQRELQIRVRDQLIDQQVQAQIARGKRTVTESEARRIALTIAKDLRQNIAKRRPRDRPRTISKKEAQQIARTLAIRLNKAVKGKPKQKPKKVISRQKKRLLFAVTGLREFNPIFAKRSRDIFLRNLRSRQLTAEKVQGQLNRKKAQGRKFTASDKAAQTSVGLTNVGLNAILGLLALGIAIKGSEETVQAATEAIKNPRKTIRNIGLSINRNPTGFIASFIGASAATRLLTGGNLRSFKGTTSGTKSRATFKAKGRSGKNNVETKIQVDSSGRVTSNVKVKDKKGKTIFSKNKNTVIRVKKTKPTRKEIGRLEVTLKPGPKRLVGAATLPARRVVRRVNKAVRKADLLLRRKLDRFLTPEQIRKFTLPVRVGIRKLQSAYLRVRNPTKTTIRVFNRRLERLIAIPTRKLTKAAKKISTAITSRIQRNVNKVLVTATLKVLKVGRFKVRILKGAEARAILVARRLVREFRRTRGRVTSKVKALANRLEKLLPFEAKIVFPKADALRAKGFQLRTKGTAAILKIQKGLRRSFQKEVTRRKLAPKSALELQKIAIANARGATSTTKVTKSVTDTTLNNAKVQQTINKVRNSIKKAAKMKNNKAKFQEFKRAESQSTQGQKLILIQKPPIVKPSAVKNTGQSVQALQKTVNLAHKLLQRQGINSLRALAATASAAGQRVSGRFAGTKISQGSKQSTSIVTQIASQAKSKQSQTTIPAQTILTGQLSAQEITSLATSVTLLTAGNTFIRGKGGRLIPVLPSLGGSAKRRRFILNFLKKTRRVFAPDLFSIVFGIRAKKGEKIRLLRKGRVFTGLERRALVR